jgi:hypothetical protein
VGARPTLRPLRPEAAGAAMEVTKWLVAHALHRRTIMAANQMIQAGTEGNTANLTNFAIGEKNANGAADRKTRSFRR